MAKYNFFFKCVHTSMFNTILACKETVKEVYTIKTQSYELKCVKKPYHFSMDYKCLVGRVINNFCI